MKFFYYTLTKQWYVDLEDCCNCFSAAELRIIADMIEAKNRETESEGNHELHPKCLQQDS